MRRRRVAIVTPWFGPECTGGAESLARELAERLSAHDEVTVLTTTSRSFLHYWDVDYHKAGETKSAGYSVIRFKVQSRDRGLFAKVNAELLAAPVQSWQSISARRERYEPFISDSINSLDLEDHLRRRAGALYDAVLFLPYLYGVVVRGIAAYPGRAHLMPCLHDEAYARIPAIEDAVHRAATLLFISSGERELALRLYGPGILAKSHVVGTGIPPRGIPAESSPIDAPFYLYIGRREPEKGVEMLVDVFRRQSNGSAPAPALVLVGPGERSYHDPTARIHDLGFVDEPTKLALLRDAIALLNPSRNESYSRVMMEAWRERIPVVVHEACLATSSAVRETQGGLVAGTSIEWFDALRKLAATNDSARREIGTRGAEYVAEHADWDKAIARIRASAGVTADDPKRRGKRVDQVLEGFDDGDAISDYARCIRQRLQDAGFQSNLYAVNLAPGVEDARRLEARSLSSTDAIIYHHSIGSKAAETALGSKGKKAMVYHNITPAHFFAPYAPDVAHQLENGRRQLQSMIGRFDILVADSDYNGRELTDFCARAVRTIPVVNDFHRFDCSPNERVLNLARGTTWLFVGRVMPNKGIRQLIEAFEIFLTLDDDAHLVIVGKFDPGDRYYNELRSVLKERRIDPYVTFTGFADEPMMVASYRSADVFVSLSEHEGFCVPLVEAMFFDVPIVAKGTTAVPGTLAGAGLVLEPDADAYAVAAAVHEVCTNALLREQIIAAQRDRRRAFTPGHIGPLIDTLAADLIATPA